MNRLLKRHRLGEIHFQDKAHFLTNKSRPKTNNNNYKPDKTAVFGKTNTTKDSPIIKNLHSENKACRKNKRCASREIKDRITNTACTRFICHLQPPVTITSHYQLSRWQFSVCITSKSEIKNTA